VRLVFFDLDGTITRHDTLFPYVLGFIRRRPRRLLGLLRVLPWVVAFAFGRADHGALKSALIKATLGGCTREEIDTWTAEFVPALLKNGVLRAALERIEAHRREGDRLILMSASPDLYVPAIADALGFAETICTGVRWVNGRLEGSLTTENRRGAEKALCFEDTRQRHPGLPTVAYANGPSDFDHLVLADEAVLVNAQRSMRLKAQAAGIRCVDWH
jgi:phosphatidylglycerophosphatase C